MPARKEATKKYAACFSTVFASFLFALSAHAASFTISDGDTRTSGQELAADGDTGTIESGGRIATTVAAVNRELSNYQWTYNHYRPHDSLALMTPMAYYQQLTEAA